jgi:outer membrane immunogenic protein
MNKLFYAGVPAVVLMAVASFAPANAADIYRRDSAPSLKDGPALMAPAAWQGLYLGGHAGYAWGDVDVRHTKTCTQKGGSTEFPTTTTVDCSAKSSFATDGFIGGGQIGYNFQRGNLVFGPEIDLGYLGLNGDKTVGAHKYSSEGGLYGDFTGRLGYAAGPTLFYAKGGAAFLDAKFDVNSASKDDTLWGWTAGAGVEHMLRPNWSVKAEYQHFDFGDTTVTSGADKIKFSPVVDAVTLGINYHVNRGYEALK